MVRIFFRAAQDKSGTSSRRSIRRFANRSGGEMEASRFIWHPPTRRAPYSDMANHACRYSTPRRHACAVESDAQTHRRPCSPAYTNVERAI
ncbi:hypothetical protein MTO96_048556 [Rhipicephalus appendiculatus]